MSKGVFEQQEKQELQCLNLQEANRMIRIMHDEISIHAQGKRFWMWLFLLNVFVSPIVDDFFSGFWKGILE